MKQNFQKSKVVTGNTLFFAVGRFCNFHSICLNTGFLHSSFVWKWWAFNFSAFTFDELARLDCDYMKVNRLAYRAA